MGFIASMDFVPPLTYCALSGLTEVLCCFSKRCVFFLVLVNWVLACGIALVWLTFVKEKLFPKFGFLRVGFFYLSFFW